MDTPGEAQWVDRSLDRTAQTVTVIVAFPEYLGSAEQAVQHRIHNRELVVVRKAAAFTSIGVY